MKTMKQLFAVLLVLCVLLSLSIPAFAAGAQYGPTKAFLDVMKREKHKYNYMGINEDGDEQINVSFSGDYMDTIDVKIFFDEDLDAVSMRSWRVINFKSSDMAKVLALVNELNNEYKYVKFVVDEEDLSVDAEIDCPLRDDANAGEIAYDALYYIVMIVDEAYPDLKAYAK